MPPRLQAKVWVSAYIRQCEAQGVSALIAAKGDETAGAILVRVNLLNGTSRVFGTAYGIDGQRRWDPVTAEDPTTDELADAYVSRARARDPDLWVVEIDNKSGDPLLDASLI